ncbi:MAG: sugar transferase [Bacteroidales bacterium]|nr:sugar transferase [Bacteroidales bacterium]
MYKSIIKRFLDFSFSIILLLVTLPFFIFIILIIAPYNSGKIFYVQKRAGIKGKLFNLIKFKTMNDKCNSSGHLLPDCERLTKTGKFLRSVSLDELPQIYNVLKGDMSLVGPRPLLPEYLPLYNERQARRHEVRPGITGWAQVNGRNNLTWNEKFEMDIWYVDNVSFKLDMKILFMTLVKVIKREGINASDRETMKPFKGNE